MGNSSLERWKEIDGYNGVYFVSDHGRVMSKFRGERILKPSINNAGYLKIHLGRHNSLDIHRLVAKEFLPNHGDKRDVNHKNGNKLDNRVENLEWVSHSDNIKHSYNVLNRKRNTWTNKAVVCEETGERFNSVRLAAKSCNVSGSVLSNQLHGRIQTAGGFHWRFV